MMTEEVRKMPQKKKHLEATMVGPQYGVTEMGQPLHYVEQSQGMMTLLPHPEYRCVGQMFFRYNSFNFYLLKEVLC